mmetsp:Transcript_11870/g.27653  ORF Transcript_11870/g.27653 Transcript_11870/m.27653 type:complete len:217 (+) Transcript_11870:85-735(+)
MLLTKNSPRGGTGLTLHFEAADLVKQQPGSSGPCMGLHNLDIEADRESLFLKAPLDLSEQLLRLLLFQRWSWFGGFSHVISCFLICSSRITTRVSWDHHQPIVNHGRQREAFGNAVAHMSHNFHLKMLQSVSQGCVFLISWRLAFPLWTPLLQDAPSSLEPLCLHHLGAGFLPRIQVLADAACHHCHQLRLSGCSRIWECITNPTTNAAPVHEPQV